MGRQSFFKKPWWEKLPTYCGGDKTAWRSLADQVKTRDGHKCMECGVLGKAAGGLAELQACHIVSKSHGGVDALFNLVTKCVACHSKEHAHMRSKGKYSL
jgi:5-methylcytosine-specific restriction endonuclease McrA